MSWKIEYEASSEIDIESDHDFHELLSIVDGNQNSFAILSKSDEYYIQTHNDGSGFVLEKREGHEGAHFIAMLSDHSQPFKQRRRFWQFWKKQDDHDKFDLATVADQFRVFAKNETPSKRVSWIRTDYS